MSNLRGNKANVALVKQSYKNLLALGEGANGADFRMTIEEFPDLEFLIQSTQWPAATREMIETKGPHGVMVNQQGNVKNAGDITIMMKEVVSGVARGLTNRWVKEKLYLTVNLALISESMPNANGNTSCTMEDCWIEIDASDLSVDDGATLYKLNGTIHYNWADTWDDTSEPMAWE